MRVRTIAILIMCFVAWACAAYAADEVKVNLDAKDTPMDQVMADLSKQSGVQIMLDTGVSGAVTGHFESIELDKLLDALTKPASLKWQKLYVQASEDQKPTLAQVKASAAAVAAITGSTVVVYDPATGKQKVFVEQDAKTPSVDPTKLGLTPVFLITKPVTETAATDQQASGVSDRFKALETERMSLLAQMTSEERKAAAQQEMVSLMSLDPTIRQQVMIDEMSARFNLPQDMRDQYRQLMRDTFQTMREQGLAPDWGGRGGGGGDRGNRGPRGNRDGN